MELYDAVFQKYRYCSVLHPAGQAAKLQPGALLSCKRLEPSRNFDAVYLPYSQEICKVEDADKIRDLFEKLQPKLHDTGGADEYFIELSEAAARKLLASVNISAGEGPNAEAVCRSALMSSTGLKLSVEGAKKFAPEDPDDLTRLRAAYLPGGQYRCHMSKPRRTYSRSGARAFFIDHVLMAQKVKLSGIFTQSFDAKNMLALKVSDMLGLSGNLEVHCSGRHYQMILSKRSDGKLFPWAIKLYYQDYRRAGLTLKFQRGNYLSQPGSEEVASDEEEEEEEEDTEEPDVELEPDGIAKEYTPFTS